MQQLAAGDTIQCSDIEDMQNVKNNLKEHGIETSAIERDGKPVLVVLDERAAALNRLKRAYVNISDIATQDTITRNLRADLRIAIEALEQGRTHADKIRNMTNEELAVFLQGIAATELDEKLHFCKNLPECAADQEKVDQKKCHMCLLRWLEEE